jgi:transposase
MLKDTQPPRYAVRRTHRTYTPQFKAQLVAACQQPGVSIAGLALQHGMNANVLHRWLKEFGQGRHRLDGVCEPTKATGLPTPSTAAFLPIELQTVPPSQRASVSPTEATPAAAPMADIRIECHRQGVSMTVHWPLSAAAECAQMLRQWLR